MIRFNVEGKEYSLPTEWEEVSLGTYLRISEVGDFIQNKYAFSELYVMRVLELLTECEPGGLDELTIQALNELSEKISYLNENPKLEIIQHIEIEGRDYAFPEDLYQIKAGEYISIKTLQEHEKNPTEFYLHLLSILLRPAKKVRDLESGRDRWVQERFDGMNLEYRRELYKKLPITKVLGTINFFLSGKNLPTSSSQDYTKKE